MNYTPLNIFYCLALDKDLDKMESYLARMYDADRFKDPAQCTLNSSNVYVLHDRCGIAEPLLTRAGIKFDDAVLELERIFKHIVTTYDGKSFGKYAFNVIKVVIHETESVQKYMPKNPAKYRGWPGNVKFNICNKVSSYHVHKHDTLGNNDVQARFTFEFSITPTHIL